MRASFWNKAIAWKEWRQHKGKFWGFGVILSITPIINPVFLFIIKAVDKPHVNPDPIFNDPAAWSGSIAAMLNSPSNSSMGIFAVLVALGLGALAVAQERSENTLEFLVATPLSRREIAGTKFLVGAGGLVCIMFVNFLFITALALILPADYTIAEAFGWFVRETAVLLALFGLGFLAAVVTGNLVASLLGALAVAFSPYYIAVILCELLQTLGIIPREYAAYDMLMNIGRYMTLPQYISDYQNFVSHAALLVPALLLAALALFFLAAALFERNPLERGGQLLVFGDTKRIIAAVSSLFVAALVTIAVGNRSSNLTLILVFLGVCLLAAGIAALVRK
jgi:ABC-type transport system involved in multi-copper enzyme maturation permease subunit